MKKTASPTRKKETRSAAYNDCTQCQRRFYAGTVKREPPICGMCQPIDGSYYDDDGLGTRTLVTPWQNIPKPYQAVEREKALSESQYDTPVTDLGYEGKSAPLRDGTQIWDDALRAQDDEFSIRLSEDDVFWASWAADQRNRANVKRGSKEAHGAAGRRLDYNIVGALGELAFARWLGATWEGYTPYTYGARDVAGFEIRSVEHPTHNLLLHDNDKPSAPYVLMVGQVDRWHIAGWIRGRDGMDPRWFTDKGNDRPAYFIPPSALRPPETLPMPRAL